MPQPSGRRQAGAAGRSADGSLGLPVGRSCAALQLLPRSQMKTHPLPRQPYEWLQQLLINDRSARSSVQTSGAMAQRLASPFCGPRFRRCCWSHTPGVSWGHVQQPQPTPSLISFSSPFSLRCESSSTDGLPNPASRTSFFLLPAAFQTVVVVSFAENRLGWARDDGHAVPLRSASLVPDSARRRPVGARGGAEAVHIGQGRLARRPTSAQGSGGLSCVTAQSLPASAAAVATGVQSRRRCGCCADGRMAELRGRLRP